MGMHNFAMFLGNAALALKEKEINENGPLYIRLAGRKSGLLDWLLTVIGINTTTVVEVYEDRIEYSYGSISGSMQETIPLSKVSNLICGRFKPVLMFLLAVIAFIAGIIMAFAAKSFGLFFVGIVFAVIFFIFYHLQKSTLISVIPNSASAIAVVFKRSIIENHNISEAEAKQIIRIINQLVDNANR